MSAAFAILLRWKRLACGLGKGVVAQRAGSRLRSPCEDAVRAVASVGGA
jgi:hypothetical protein